MNSRQQNENSQGRIEVLQLTDPHLFADPSCTLLGVNTDASLRDVIELAQTRPRAPDCMLLTGDLAQDGSALAYHRLGQYLDALEIPCYCLPGNHDDPALMRSILNRGRVRCQSQAVFGHWQIIFLDSTVAGKEGGRLGETELGTLESHLREHPKKHALIVLHHPPIPVGSRWMDTMVLADTERFWDLLGGYPSAVAVVSGHVHQEVDVRRRNLRILATPSTCFQFQPRSREFALDPRAPGYRWISLLPEGRIETAVFRMKQSPAGVAFHASGY